MSVLARKYNSELVTKAWVEEILESKLQTEANFKQFPFSTGTSWFNLGPAVTNVWSVAALDRGTASNQFVGAGLQPVSLKIRGSVESVYTAADACTTFIWRILVVQALTAKAAMTDVIQNQAGVLTLSNRYLPGIETFTILHDRLFTTPAILTAGGALGWVTPFEFFVPGNKLVPLEMVPGATAPARTRGDLLVMATVSSCNLNQIPTTANIAFQSELIYTDT